MVRTLSSSFQIRQDAIEIRRQNCGDEAPVEECEKVLISGTRWDIPTQTPKKEFLAVALGNEQVLNYFRVVVFRPLRSIIPRVAMKPVQPIGAFDCWVFYVTVICAAVLPFSGKINKVSTEGDPRFDRCSCSEQQNG